MKIFAIQKTQPNIYASKFKQNDSGTTKTNPAGDTFVSSKVSFGMATKLQLETEIANLQRRLDTEKLTKAAREAIEDSIGTLRAKIITLYGDSGDGTTEHYEGIDPFRL